jgi:shikimate kinase
MTLLTLAKPVVLVGMMGAGKSSAGRKLAELLKVPFYDCDWEIEQSTGLTIRHYFAAHGEAAFRALEQKVILDLCAKRPCGVIASGGGTFIQAAVRPQLLAAASVLWLKASLDTLASRVLGPQLANRPLLANSDDPKSVLARLIDERGPVYGLAHATIVVDGMKPEAVSSKLREALQTLPGALA